MTDRFEPYRRGGRVLPPDVVIEPIDVSITFRGETVRYVMAADSRIAKQPGGLEYELGRAVRPVVEAVLKQHAPRSNRLVIARKPEDIGPALERLVDSDPPPADLADRINERRNRL